MSMWGKRDPEEKARKKAMQNRLRVILSLDLNKPAQRPIPSPNHDAPKNNGEVRQSASLPVASSQDNVEIKSATSSHQQGASLLGSDSPRPPKPSQGDDATMGSALQSQTHSLAKPRVTSKDPGLPPDKVDSCDPQTSSTCESLKPKPLNSEGMPPTQVTPDASMPADSNSSGLQTQADVNRMDARLTTVRAALDRFNKKTQATLQGRTMSPGTGDEMPSPAQANLTGPVEHVEVSSLSSDGVPQTAESLFIDSNEQRDQVLVRQSKLLEERLAQIADRTLSQAEANAHRTISRMEAYLAQAEEVKSSIDGSLTNLVQKSKEAADVQTEVLEANLAKITDQIASRVDAVLNQVASRIDGYRAEVEQMRSSSERTLAGFNQRINDAAQVQTQDFEREMARICEQTASQGQENLSSEITRLREAATHSLEGQIASIVERIQHCNSQTETLLARVEESRIKYESEVEKAQQGIREISQKEIESTIETLKGKITKVVEAVAVNISHETQDRVHNEAAAVIKDFIESDCRIRVQQALSDSYEKGEQDLIAKIEKLYSERQQVALNQLQTSSERLSAESIAQIQNSLEEHVGKAVNVLKERMFAQTVQQGVRMKESAETLSRNLEAGLQEHLQTWSRAQIANLQRQGSSLFADLLRSTRAELESVTQDLRERLNSDTDQMQAKVLENIEGRLRKINEGFRSTVESTFS